MPEGTRDTAERYLAHPSRVLFRRIRLSLRTRHNGVVERRCCVERLSTRMRLAARLPPPTRLFFQLLLTSTSVVKGRGVHSDTVARTHLAILQWYCDGNASTSTRRDAPEPLHLTAIDGSDLPLESRIPCLNYQTLRGVAEEKSGRLRAPGARGARGVADNSIARAGRLTAVAKNGTSLRASYVAMYETHCGVVWDPRARAFRKAPPWMTARDSRLHRILLPVERYICRIRELREQYAALARTPASESATIIGHITQLDKRAYRAIYVALKVGADALRDHFAELYAYDGALLGKEGQPREDEDEGGAMASPLRAPAATPELAHGGPRPEQPRTFAVQGGRSRGQHRKARSQPERTGWRYPIGAHASLGPSTFDTDS